MAVNVLRITIACLFLVCFISATVRLSVYFLLFRKYGFDLVKVNETHSGILSL